jgi:hypothetical protein
MRFTGSLEGQNNIFNLSFQTLLSCSPYLAATANNTTTSMLNDREHFSTAEFRTMSNTHYGNWDFP